jgi:hypothetical protein
MSAQRTLRACIHVPQEAAMTIITTKITAIALLSADTI